MQDRRIAKIRSERNMCRSESRYFADDRYHAKVDRPLRKRERAALKEYMRAVIIPEVLAA